MFSIVFLLFVVFVAELVRVPPAIAADRPPIELPVELRHANYSRGSHAGSCAYAAAEDLLSLQGRDDLARYVRQHYAGGALPCPSTRVPSLVDLAESLGLPYDYTDAGGDANWLQSASDQRLGAVVHWVGAGRGGVYGTHAITFLGFDADGFAWFLDNNEPAYYGKLPRARFLSIWKWSGGDAFTFNLPQPEE